MTPVCAETKKMALRLSSHRLCTATSLLKPNAQLKLSTSCCASGAAAMAAGCVTAVSPFLHPPEGGTSSGRHAQTSGGWETP